MKLYKTEQYGGCKITEVESSKQTEHTVTVDGCRYNWVSSYYAFFKTYEEAKQHLIKRAIEAKQGAQNRLNYALDVLKEVERL